MILTNERVAELLERRRVPTHLPGPRAAGPGADRADGRAARRPRHPDAAAAGRRSPRSRRASWPARRAAWSPGRPSAAVTAARRIHRLCSARCKQAHYSGSQPRPRRPRQPGLLPTSPRRSAATRTWSPTARCCRRSGRGRRRRGPRGSPRSAAHCSERERDATRIERDADYVCASFLLERELFERGPGHPVRGRGLGRGRGRRLRPLRRRARRRLRGLPAGSPDRRPRALRARRDRDDAGRALEAGGAIRIGDPVTVASTGSRRPAAASTCCPPRADGEEVEGTEDAGERATSPPTGAPGTSSSCWRGWRPASSCRAPR